MGPSRERGRGANLRTYLPEVFIAIWIAFGATILVLTSGRWASKAINAMDFLISSLCLMGLFFIASILYIIKNQKLEALFSENWRHILAGLILLAFSGWIDLVEVTFHVPSILHYFKHASVALSLAITTWYLSEALLDASKVLMPVHKVPLLRPSWMAAAWAALALVLVLASRPWAWETLTPPRGVEMAFDAACLLITGMMALKIALSIRRSSEPSRWLLEGGASILALSALTSAFELFNDAFRIPSVLKILGVDGTGALAFGLTIAVLSYYHWGTTSLRTPLPLQISEVEEGIQLVEKVWQQLGDLSGRVILIERSTVTPYTELLEGLARSLRKSGFALVIITRRGSYVGFRLAKLAAVTLHVSSSRAGPPRQLGPGEFEIGVEPSIMLGLLGRVQAPEDKLAVLIEDTSGLLILLGEEDTYRLVRAIIDRLIPKGSVIVMVLSPGAHEERIVNLFRGLATDIIDVTRTPPTILRTI